MRPIYNAPSTKPKKAPSNPNASGYTLPLHMQHCVNMSSQQRLVGLGPIEDKIWAKTDDCT